MLMMPTLLAFLFNWTLKSIKLSWSEVIKRNVVNVNPLALLVLITNFNMVILFYMLVGTTSFS